MKEINYYADKDKAKGLLVLAIVMMCGVLAVFYIALKEMSLFMFLLGGISFVFFGKEFLYLLKIISHAQGTLPVINVNEQGIKEVSLSTSGGLIEWKNIDYIKVRENFGTSVIVIKLIDKKAYLRQVKFYPRLITNLNCLLKFEPIVIATNRIDKNPQVLVDEILDYKKLYIK